jgi:hypothetical protein
MLKGLPHEEGRHELQADLEQLVRLYANLTESKSIQVKLESFGDDHCERFHADWVPLRMICSYAGRGTEWLDDADVDRRLLGPAAGDLPDEISGLMSQGACVGSMERFAVGLMKGELWPGNRGRGLIHRSPRIQGSNQRRVLLKIEGEKE